MSRGQFLGARRRTFQDRQSNFRDFRGSDNRDSRFQTDRPRRFNMREQRGDLGGFRRPFQDRPRRNFNDNQGDFRGGRVFRSFRGGDGNSRGRGFGFRSRDDNFRGNDRGGRRGGRGRFNEDRMKERLDKDLENMNKRNPDYMKKKLDDELENYRTQGDQGTKQ